MRKIVIAMSPFCSIYYVDFSHLIEKDRIDVGEVLIIEIDLVLAAPPHSVSSDRKDDHPEYDTIGVNGMEGMARVLGDIRKPGAYTHFFCSARTFAFWCNALASEERKSVPVSGSVPKRAGQGATRTGVQSVGLRFEIENSTLRNILKLKHINKQRPQIVQRIRL